MLVELEYRIDPARSAEFIQAARELERIRRRDGAFEWWLLRDATDPALYIETFAVETWAEHLRQHERVSAADRAVEDRVMAFHLGPGTAARAGTCSPPSPRSAGRRRRSRRPRVGVAVGMMAMSHGNEVQPRRITAQPTMSAEDTIRSLREALAVSPDNVPLRKHLAQSLMGMARFAEAESEFREALRRAPADEELKLGLARAFASNGKRSEALVILEEMIRSSKHPSAAYVLQARLLLGGGETARAVREYRKAIEADPDVADGELAEPLGIGADEHSESDVVDGRVRASQATRNRRSRDLRIETPGPELRATSAAWTPSRKRSG